MNRRDFFKASAISSVAIGLGTPLSSKVVNEQLKVAGNKRHIIDPVIPFRFYFDEKDKMFSQMIEMKEKYGLRKFLLTAPMDEIKLQGYPPNEVYQEIGQQVLFVKEKLKPYDIQIGWWCAPTLRSGPDGPFQYITDLSGAVADSTPCPMDPGFKEDFSENVATVARIARPFRIQFEDDYELSWQPPNVRFGCFCPLHMAEFSKRENRKYTREELIEIFKEVTPESIRLRKAWAKLSKETLVDFATTVREKIDKIDPTISITLCQAGCSDIDGDFIEEVTRAFAGNTRPSVRLYGSSYANDDLLSLPGMLFHALYSKQHLPIDFECLHETDSYPHTRYFTSANMMKCMLTVIFSYGFDDTLFYATQYLDNPLEDRGYVEMYKNEVNRLSVLKEEVRDCEVAGCEIIYDPAAHVINPHGGVYSSYSNAWVSVAGRFGIPYTSRKSKVKLISGNITEMMSDSEIRSLLSEGVFLDGTAAEYLYKRGYGKLLGVESVERGTDANFCSEAIRHPEKYKNIQGKLMYNLIFAPAGAEGGAFFRIKPMNKAEVITDFLDPNKKPVIPGMITFENDLGGRIAILSFDLSRNASSSIYNYKKKELIRQTIDWLGKKQLPVCIVGHPNIFCVFNKANNNKYGIVTVINLTADCLDSVDIAVDDEWINAKVEILRENGKWESLKTAKRKVKGINTSLATLSPVVLKLIKE